MSESYEPNANDLDRLDDLDDDEFLALMDSLEPDETDPEYLRDNGDPED